MKEQLLEEIIACLPQQRSLFRYYKDQYAVYLLQHLCQRSLTRDLKAIRHSPWGKLLNKPILAGVLKQSGSGSLNTDQLDCLWPTNPEHYVLTLGRWGSQGEYGWNQTSRPGMNLVLQLNLKSQYDLAFRSMAGCKANEFCGGCHPFSLKRDATLAWARLDMDFSTGELLIEEIQSDLIRDLEKLYRLAQERPTDSQGRFYFYGFWFDKAKALQYCAQLLATQKKLWSEAMMTAALWFAHKELGIHKVYYHTFDTGSALKNIRWSKPPRSIYTDLPEQFCFQQVHTTPEFIAKDKKAARRLKAIESPEWYLMAS